MTDTSEFEDVVEMMMEKNELKDCLDFIETKIDQNVVLDTPYLFDTKLNCLYELDRKMDAFMEAKAYRADYRPLTSIVCIVLGNGYDKEGNYTEAHFYFSQYMFDGQDAILSRLVKEIEREVKIKLDEKKYEECFNYIGMMSQDLVYSNEDVFDSKLKCLAELDRKQEALNEAKAHLKSGGVLSHNGFEILGSSCAASANYDEARQYYICAIKSCRTREEKLRYHNLLKNMEKEEERKKMRKEDKRVAKIDPSFLKGGNKRNAKNFTKSTEKKVDQKKNETGEKKEVNRLQCVEDLEGDPNKKEELEVVVVEEKADSFGESNIERLKEISVTNREFSSNVKFSVVEFRYDVFNVVKEDHFDKSPMSLVKATKKHLENLNLLKSWGYDLPFMARVESALPSNSISSHPLLVVEYIQPLHVFFSLEREKFMKTNSFSTSKERDWWEYIRERFRLIFRDIICGLFFLHSENRVCCDFRDSLYVSKEGKGKILHNFSREFSYSHAKDDVKDLLMLILVAIRGQLVDSKDRTCQFKELKESFNLPDELVHFLCLLNRSNKDIALGKLPSTWLIDHPYFWDDKHRISFIKYLKDAMKEDMILEAAFDNLLESTWSAAVKDDLLHAILDYKWHSYRSDSSIVFYMNAVYSHINDYRYKKFRGYRKFDDGEIECLLRKTFPNIYIFLFGVLCHLSVKNPMHYAEILKKLSFLKLLCRKMWTMERLHGRAYNHFQFASLHHYVELCGVREPVIVIGAYVISSFLAVVAGYVGHASA